MNAHVGQVVPSTELKRVDAVAAVRVLAGRVADNVVLAPSGCVLEVPDLCGDVVIACVSFG
jgi:hypothetical protein